MSTEIYHIHLGDTSKAIQRQLKYDDDNGNEVALNLTGFTVEFTMVLASDGTIKVARTAATVDDATTGKVSYTFLDADVDTAGTYYGYFIAIDGSSDEDTYPVLPGDLQIVVHGDV